MVPNLWFFENLQGIFHMKLKAIFLMEFLLKIEGDFGNFYVDFFFKIEGEFNFLVNFFFGPIQF